MFLIGSQISWWLVALMHDDESRIACICNLLNNHEHLTVRMYSVAEGGALGSKSQRLTVPYGVPKQASREEKCMSREPVDLLGANSVGKRMCICLGSTFFNGPCHLRVRGNWRRLRASGRRRSTMTLAWNIICRRTVSNPSIPSPYFTFGECLPLTLNLSFLFHLLCHSSGFAPQKLKTNSTNN